MIFKYTTVDTTGAQSNGTIDALNQDVALASLQRRGLVVVSIVSADEKGSVFERNISLFERVKTKEIVIVSRQIATLFEAQVSALRVFQLISEEVENPLLQKILTTVASDLQAGSSISKALAKHPKVFSPFYVSMVLSGEESGKLDKTFEYLADYLDRTFAVTSKAKNALIYPAFVIATFVAVMVLMLTLVIPRISQILIDSGQEIPIFTKIVIGFSNFLVNYGLFLGIFLAIGGFFMVRFVRTDAGKRWFDRFKISIPYVGDLYRKLYLSRIADNMNTMILSGISMVRVIEITATVVDNLVYQGILEETLNSVKSGKALSESFSDDPEIPGIMRAMIKVGEESGELGNILKTLARFYEREVITAVDTMVDLIEPIMIVSLGLGVGFLLVAVLLPIYNISSAI